VSGNPPAIDAVTPPGEGTVEVLVTNHVQGIPVPAAATLRFTYRPRQQRFVRGDSNGDGDQDLSDAVSVLGYLYLGTVGPPCLSAADANDSGSLDLSDPVASLIFLFQGAAGPPLPFPDCGVDPTPDGLPCDLPPACP
jgi:hypothetical protein